MSYQEMRSPTTKSHHENKKVLFTNSEPLDTKTPFAVKRPSDENKKSPNRGEAKSAPRDNSRFSFNTSQQEIVRLNELALINYASHQHKTLPQAAADEVYLKHDGTHEDRILRAPISKTPWEDPPSLPTKVYMAIELTRVSGRQQYLFCI